MNKIINALLFPFTELLPWFMSLWMVCSLVDTIAWIVYGNIPFAGYMSLHGYIMSYLLLLVYGIIKTIDKNGIISHLYISILCFGGIINICTDIVCHYNFHFGFVTEVVDVIRGTNINESTEFLQTFMSINVIFYCIATICIISFIYFGMRLLTRTTPARKISKVIGPAILCFSFGLIAFKKSENWGGIFINKIYSLMCGGSVSAPDLTHYRTSLNLTYKEQALPQKVIVIIGESHSNRHSSLYGYRLATEPLLETRVEDSTLYVFQNAEAPATGTVTAFTKILNSSLIENIPDSIWYKSKTIFDIARTLGYSTYWISNQDRRGMYDNIPASYSFLCDTALWAGKKFIDAGRMNMEGNYDENVLNLYKSYKSSIKDKSLIVFHLMGSHEAFTNRYPDNFKKFSATNYKDMPENQRKVIAEYDNSILYNDYVVHEIIKLFENEDVLLFYFSDHSLDIFDSTSDFYGHARPSDPSSVEAGKAIPFFIYTSPTYKRQRPQKIEQIVNDMQKPINTGYFWKNFCEYLDVTIMP